MPLGDSSLSVFASYAPGFRHAAPLRPAPSARADGPVADDAHDVRAKVRVYPMDTNRPDYDAVPEHDPDGTPWAA